MAPRSEIRPHQAQGRDLAAERRKLTAQSDDSVLGTLDPVRGLRKEDSRGGRGPGQVCPHSVENAGGPGGFQANLVTLGDICWTMGPDPSCDKSQK